MNTKIVRAGSALVFLTIVVSATGSETVSDEVTPLPLRENVRHRFLQPFQKPILTFHVSPGGSASGDGTEVRAFGSLERARDEIRARRHNGKLPQGAIEVQVHGGEYFVSDTFVLGASDSGSETSPVIYRAPVAEKPVFRGGVRLSGWTTVPTGDYPLLSTTARTAVRVVELQSCGVTNLLPLKLGGFASGNGFRTHPAHELFFNGKAMTLARGPNEGFLRIRDVAVKDGTKGYDRQGSKVGKFFYDGDLPSRWAAEPDLLLYGYWFWDWADSYERVAKIEPNERLITLAEPWHNYGFSTGAPFYAVNAISELDLPGEWYLDRAKGRVLLYAPSTPDKATVELSIMNKPMLQMDNVSWVQFQGLTWELGSADALRVKEGSHCLFAGCTVRHFAGNGIEISGGKQHTVLSCNVHSMGRGGTLVSGGDRKTLTPGAHLLENCDIYDLSRIDHTYTPAVILNGVGNRIANNRMHDVRSSALRVEGNDHLVEYNEVYNVVTESDDQGAVDMFGNPTYRGNVYRFNYWHHIGNWRATGEYPKCGQAGIRLDDAICGTRICGNVFERCSTGKVGFGGVQIHGGKDNLIENNLFIGCAAVISCTPWNENRWREHIAKALSSPEVDRDLYTNRYPELARLSEDPNMNRVRRNLAWRCNEMFRRAPRNLEASENLMLGQDEFSWDAKNLRLERPGFDPIPFQEIGLYKDPYRPLN